MTTQTAAPRREAAKPLARITWDGRAPRHFEPDPIPDEDMETILALAAQAPSGFNLQPWRFIIVRDPATRQRLRDATMGQETAAEAPVVIVAFGRREAWSEYADAIFQTAADNGAIEYAGLEQQKADAIAFVSRMPVTTWLNRHVMTAFTYMMLTAEAMGWDTAPTEDFDSAAVADAVGLPDDAEVVAMLAIGRHRDSDTPHPGRLAKEQLFFAERFGSPWIESALDEAAL